MYYVYQPAALQIVLWNVIALPLHVVTVSTLHTFVTSAMVISFLACPCHTDCIDGCQGCDNPVCFCNVSRNNQ